MVKSSYRLLRSFLFKDDFDISRVVYLYRYLSWFMTSLFYILAEPEAPFIYKIGVSLSLLLAAKFTTDLYIKNRENRKNLISYVLVETIGITILLLPTGGISSPFIWYALNPVLVAVSFLPRWFCWINLFIYITSALFMSYVFFNRLNNSIFELIKNNSNNILVLILITFTVEMLSDLTKQIRKKANELEKKQHELFLMNEHLKESIENIMALYQTVETFSNQSNIKDFLKVFTEYAAKLTRTELAFFWMASYEGRDSVIALNRIDDVDERMINDIEKYWENKCDTSKLKTVDIMGRKFVVSLVKSQSRTFGLIGIELNNTTTETREKECAQKLGFIAELSGVILERFHYENIANSLMVMEEQNRIANEMHDNVSQRMFSIACAIHAVKSRWKEMSEENISEQLEIINESSKNAMKELRLAIYGLSYKKRGEKVFESNIRTYFNEISKLNNIDVELNMQGDPDILPAEYKKAVHRIIYEATGNAVRHGKCSKIKVDMITDNESLILAIKDNGTGFKIVAIQNGNNGLGIQNMKRLTQSFNGSFDINTEQGAGTEININIPYNLSIKERGTAI